MRTGFSGSTRRTGGGGGGGGWYRNEEFDHFSSSQNYDYNQQQPVSGGGDPRRRKQHAGDAGGDVSANTAGAGGRRRQYRIGPGRQANGARVSENDATGGHQQSNDNNYFDGARKRAPAAAKTGPSTGRTKPASAKSPTQAGSGRQTETGGAGGGGAPSEGHDEWATASESSDVAESGRGARPAHEKDSRSAIQNPTLYYIVA